MTNCEIQQEIYVLRQHLLAFEHKYSMSSEAFFAAYQNGEEPADAAWVLDWAEWAGSYKLWQKRLMQFQA